VCLGALSGSSVFAQTVSSPWTFGDVGAPLLAGRASGGPSTFTIEAAGADIWGTSDQFGFVYQQVTGDVDVVARIDSITRTHEWAKAGVMIRSALTANAAHAFSVVSAARGVAFMRRRAVGGLSTSTGGPASAAPYWVRLLRRGSQVTSLASADGVTWTTIGTDTIALGASAYVGIVATSHNVLARTAAVVSRAQITPLSLPAGQQHADIGSPALAGDAAYVQGTHYVVAAGRDIWDTSDQFHFIYQQVTGNVEIVGRVLGMASIDPWTKSGLMIRESLAANSKNAFALMTPGNGHAFQVRTETGGLTEYTNGGAGGAPGWLKLVRSGSVLQAYRSADGQTWTSIGADSIAMSGTVYVGIAVTSHKSTAATLAAVDNLRITETQPVNQPPTVSITSPASGATFTAPATVALTASASDPENRMSRVDFYRNGTLISGDSTAPFTATIASVAAGTYSLTAIARDLDGATATSAAVNITVTAAVSPPRLLVFQRSVDHAVVTSYLLEVFAAGANPATATPIATSNLGKPTPATNGDITVDRATFFAALAPGTYQATVSSINSNGRSRSAPVDFSR
jgi:hypothetical protein